MMSVFVHLRSTLSMESPPHCCANFETRILHEMFTQTLNQYIRTIAIDRGAHIHTFSNNPNLRKPRHRVFHPSPPVPRNNKILFRWVQFPRESDSHVAPSMALQVEGQETSISAITIAMTLVLAAVVEVDVIGGDKDLPLS